MTTSADKLIFGTLFMAGIGWGAWKATSLLNMKDNITITPKIGGAPTVSDGLKVRIPIALNMANKSSGTLTFKILSGAAYVGDTIAANVEAIDSSYTIAPNSTTTINGLRICLNGLDLINTLSTNIAEITNGGFESLKSMLSIELELLVEGMVNVRVRHSFAQSGEMSGLALSASSPRPIRHVSEYSHLIPPRAALEMTDPIKTVRGNEDTIGFMIDVVRKTKSDTVQLARHLRQERIEDTIRAIYDFVYHYIQYTNDSTLREQVRRPLRTLWEQKGDCDCFATLIGSILANLGIPFTFRMAALYNRDYYQHVYVIVPTEGGYYVCDPVLDKCFEECKATKYKDFQYTER